MLCCDHLVFSTGPTLPHKIKISLTDELVLCGQVEVIVQLQVVGPLLHPLLTYVWGRKNVFEWKAEQKSASEMRSGVERPSDSVCVLGFPSTF